jgi:hypothetical protein
MNYQQIAQMARDHIICSEEAEYLYEFLEFTLMFSYSKWFLLRTTTIQKILSGHITQTDSPIITAFTLSNNIARRSMEFITTEPRPVENDEQDDEDAYGDDEFNNAEHVYVNPHFNYDDEDYEDYDHHNYMQDEDYAYEHEDI